MVITAQNTWSLSQVQQVWPLHFNWLLTLKTNFTYNFNVLDDNLDFVFYELPFHIQD